MPKALEGVRVLDLTHVLAGPFCTMLLGHLGADVIKLEPKKGDRFRGVWLDPDIAALRPGYEFLLVNTNKRGITLNLKTEKGRELFRELVGLVDVVVENFGCGAMERLGFGYEQLRDINPRIIYATGKGFGVSGPYKDRAAAANVAMALGGWTGAAWERDDWHENLGRPEPGTKIIGPGDEACGVSLALGILGALFYRERTGVGQMIEVSMQEAIVGFLVSQLHEWFEGQPIGDPPMKCADGYYTLSGYFAQDHQWQRLCEIMERPELTSDPQYATATARYDNATELYEMLEEWVRTKTRKELWDLLEPLKNVNGPILSIGEVVEDPHMKARGAWEDMDDTLGGTWPIPKPWIRMSETPCSIEHPSPALGQHNDEVYGKLLGRSKQQIDELRAEGVI